MTGTMERTLKYIWEFFEKNSDYERAFGVDFEKFTNENEVEIYVSIK